MTTPQQDIRNLTFQQLQEYLLQNSEQKFRTKQIFKWIYQQGVTSFDEMTNLSQSLRDKLANDFVLSAQEVVVQETSQDGTMKFLFELADGEKIETVLIPTKSRTTACITSQAGCKFGCRFCASGIGGWKRNLTPAEILGQIMYVKQVAEREYDRPLSHLVFMGTGETFDTYDNLMQAVRIINAPEGINIGARRITVSTVGLVPKIEQFAKEGLQLELAISLHGFNNESRNKLMPVNKKYPFDELMDACRDYIAKTKRQITFEYILIKDVTCTEEAVKELRRHLKGMICKMNLIPYNPVKEFDHQTPTRAEMFQFRDQLVKAGIHATIRTPRGKDINGACGQLRYQQA